MPNPAVVKKRLESLIEREFLERVANDRKQYRCACIFVWFMSDTFPFTVISPRDGQKFSKRIATTRI